MTHRLYALLMIAALLAFSPLAGCATSDSRVTTLPGPGPLTVLALDIENPYGGVRVEVSDKSDHVCMTESLLTAAFSTDELREDFQQRMTLETERVEGAPGHETIRVRVVALEPIKTKEGVNLTIKLPSCEGIRVRNTAGSAVLVGVTGAIHVETIDGDIEVRCDEPVRSPVALIADSGDVYLQAPGGDEGRVELVSNTGKAVFTSTLEPLVGLTATTNQVRGTLGGGVYPITLRSDSGDVRMMVIEDPLGYTRLNSGNQRMASPEKYKGEEAGG